MAGAHGVRGLVRIKSFTAEPEAIAGYGPLCDESRARRFELEVLGQAPGKRAADVVLARIAGVTDRDAAEALRGVRLYVERSALPQTAEEEEYYYADLIGLRCDDPAGTPFARVQAVHDFGASDLLELSVEAGIGRKPGTVLVPFTREVVPVVDIAGGYLVVDPPEGLIERPEEDETEA